MKLILIGFCFAILMSFTLVYAQAIVTTEKASFPMMQWVSKNTNDIVTIQNGNSVPIVIMITVNGNTHPNPPGITIRNCGSTTNIKAGSSSLCYNSDAANPVTFSSDSATPVDGTYQIKQQ